MATKFLEGTELGGPQVGTLLVLSGSLHFVFAQYLLAVSLWLDQVINANTLPETQNNQTNQVVSALAQMCVELHTSVEEASARYYAQLRRRWARRALSQSC